MGGWSWKQVVLCFQPAARPHRMHPQPPLLGDSGRPPGVQVAPQVWGRGWYVPLWWVPEPQGTSVSSGWMCSPGPLAPEHLGVRWQHL